MNQQELESLIKEHREIKAEHIPALKDMVDTYPFFTIARLLYLRALQQKRSLSFDAQLQKSFLYIPDRAWLYYYLYPEKQAQLEYAKPKKSQERLGGYFDLLEAAGQDTEAVAVDDSLKVLAERLKQARLFNFKSQAVDESVQRGESEHASDAVIKHELSSEQESEVLAELDAERQHESDLFCVSDSLNDSDGEQEIDTENEFDSLDEADNDDEYEFDSYVLDDELIIEGEFVKEDALEQTFSSRLNTGISLENYQEKIKMLIQKQDYSQALEILNELYLNNPKKNVYFADQIRFIKKIIANS